MKFEALARGCYLEALCIRRDAVLYSDVATGGIHCVREDGTTDHWLADELWITGMLCNDDGSVLYSGPHGIAWLNPRTGASGTLIDSVDGKLIPGINEMTPDRKGGLYFGAVDLESVVHGAAPRPAAVYHMDSERRLTKLCEGLRFSNGLALSLDGRHLYHNESFVGTFAYDVNADGTLGERFMMREMPDCDGMALDQEGNIWITGFGTDSLICLRPDGEEKSRIKLPAKAATNVRFGGADGRELYVTTVAPEVTADLANGRLPTSALSTLYRGRSDIAGHPVEPTSFRLL